MSRPDCAIRLAIPEERTVSPEQPAISRHVGELDAWLLNRGLQVTYETETATGVYEDLVQSGVIDPAKVARLALQNAASISSLLLTTETIVSEEEGETADAVPPLHA